MNRRFFMRAAPAAAALAPSVVRSAAMDGPKLSLGSRPYAGSDTFCEPIADGEWERQHIAQLRDTISGKRNERDFRGPSDLERAASVDALRSVSAVNKHRMARERTYAAHYEQQAWYARFELADLLKRMIR